MIAASDTGSGPYKPGRTSDSVWHTLRVPVRVLAILSALAAMAVIVASAGARSGSAKATAAVVSGDLGRVAYVRASGDDGKSRSIPANTPDGITLGDGFVSVTTATGKLSASAQ